MLKKRIGIIGIGKMGEALVSGLLRSQIIDASYIVASDVKSERRDYISEKYQIRCYPTNLNLVESCDIIVLAIGPRDLTTVLDDIGEALSSHHIIISIVAGVSTTFILKHLRKQVALIRAMPNNPCTIGEGMTVIASTARVTKEDLQNVIQLFSSMGRTLSLEEKYFNGVTGLSGSGPAYVYLFVEALADGGVKVGIPKEEAIFLAAQTVLGSAKMILETGQHPAKLKDMVATPQGTTVAGLFALEEGKIRSIVIKAVEEATQRASELEMD